MQAKLLFAMSAVVAVSANQAPVVSEVTAQLGASSLPTVFMHGMGDSCFNAGCVQRGFTQREGGRHTHEALLLYFCAPDIFV